MVHRYGDDWEIALARIRRDRALAQPVADDAPVLEVERLLARARWHDRRGRRCPPHAPDVARSRRATIDDGMTETDTLDQQLEEIGVQLDWVRDYL